MVALARGSVRTKFASGEKLHACSAMLPVFLGTQLCARTGAWNRSINLGPPVCRTRIDCFSSSHSPQDCHSLVMQPAVNRTEQQSTSPHNGNVGCERGRGHWKLVGRLNMTLNVSQQRRLNPRQI